MTVIDVLLFDGCEALDALVPLEVLAYAGLDVCSVAHRGPRAIRTSQGLSVLAETAPRDDAEWLIVPGGAWATRRSHPTAEPSNGTLGRLAIAHRAEGGKLAAVCTGAMWLADAGILQGRQATTHHQYWDELAGLGVTVRRGERVVDDGDVVTSGGITSGLFLGLYLVERLVGHEAREAVESEIEFPTIPGFS